MKFTRSREHTEVDMYKQAIYNNVPKLTLYVNYYGEDVDKKGTRFPNHYHDEIELLVIYSGKKKCVCGDKTLIGRPGDVIFINSLVPHSTEILEDGTENGIIQFKKKNLINTDIPQIITYLPASASADEQACAVLSSPELFRAADEIIRESYETERGYDMFVRSALYRVIGIMRREGVISELDGIRDTREVRKILPALEYINKSYSEDIKLEQMSEMLSFDPSYFCRIFKSATGATFTEYLNFVRVCKSERLLRESDKSIFDISEEVGFSSPTYYNRMFNKYKGLSPRAYRQAENDIKRK